GEALKSRLLSSGMVVLLDRRVRQRRAASVPRAEHTSRYAMSWPAFAVCRGVAAWCPHGLPPSRIVGFIGGATRDGLSAAAGSMPQHVRVHVERHLCES